MKLRRIREDMGDHVKMKKAALLSIAINVLEIVAGVAMVVLVNQLLSHGVEETIARMTSLLCLTVVGWGALTDIGASLTSLRMVQKTRELEQAYTQLEDLNREMRAQRHDFLNHIQVVYSLIEMGEPDEAMAYMDKIYGDMQRVSRMLRTDCPAVNALIQAKVVEAQQRGAELKLSIAAKWDDKLMPAWEICRVLPRDFDAIAHTIVNSLAITSGIICDGAKPSCAGKIASAISAGLLGMEMYEHGSQFYGGDGIIAKGIENTLRNVGRLGAEGMRGTDETILDIMTRESR